MPKKLILKLEWLPNRDVPKRFSKSERRNAKMRKALKGAERETRKCGNFSRARNAKRERPKLAGNAKMRKAKAGKSEFNFLKIKFDKIIIKNQHSSAVYKWKSIY
jgi:hypothetical protein